MTVKSFFPDAYVIDAENRYYLVLPDGERRPITRKHAAQITFDPELPVGWVIEWETVESLAPACPWCGARPLVFERDVDGWASTGSCGSDQCNRLARCEGCGKDDCAAISSFRGRLCQDCNEVSYRTGLVAARDRYALITEAEYYGKAA